MPNKNTSSTGTPKVTGIGGIFFFLMTRQKPKNGIQKTWGLKPTSTGPHLNSEMRTDRMK